MKKRVAAMLLMTSVLLSGCGSAVPEEFMEEEQETDEEVILDPASIRPQDDFNGYVNAEYLMSVDLDEHSGSYGSFEAVQDMVDEQLEGIIEEILNGDRASYASGSNEQLIYDAYYQLLEASCGGEFMNEEDVSDMLATIERIQNTQTIEAFLELSGELYKTWNANPIFGLSVDSDMHNSSAGSIWLEPFSDPGGQKLKQICVGGRMGQTVAMYYRIALSDSGMNADEAKERSVATARMIIDIAQATDLDLIDRMEKDWSVAMQTAQYKTAAEVDAICPNVGMAGLLKTMGLPADAADGVYLWDAGQLAKIDSLLTEEHLKEWQDIALMAYRSSIGDLLTEDYGGHPVLYSNNKYALDGVKFILGKELGEEYTERYYDEQTVEAVCEITKQITEEYKVMIDECDWLSAEGKSAIRGKLDHMMYFIGADEPHTVDPKDAALIGHSVYDTQRRFNSRDYEERMDVLQNGVERNGFQNMAPMSVNACYSPDMNAINITPAIMNPPFYSPEQTDAENLGGIGAVVGHEISHAFDNHGMLFDSNGNYEPDWMPQEDRDAFDAMAAQIEEYYSRQMIMGIHPVDGELTLGENLADISGVDCILRLAKTNEERKELLENYARVWACVSQKDGALAQLYSDVHSPAITRVNAVVALFDPFYEIYDVKEGDAMYVAPEERVTRW